ncbi:hypothetical protein [uncultured Aquimarina sp.]|uniref:hypothetical protein n=1 Tax=uncultured Aquimarina sp. TaxID=575652 RepID=UPI0026111015|nr:hypothetical protein [uncultured Aquimarina sp.]
MKSSITDTLKEIDIKDQKITRKELYNCINKASAHRDTVIKLYKEKEEDYIVIFSWKDRNKWKIDYPIQLHKIHKQRYVTHKQCLQLSEHIFSGNSLDDLKGFIDVPVRHFTLDEMLQFKQEDEMMLRGDDPDLLIPTPTPSEKQEILETQKNNLEQKKISKSSLILGDIAVPKEKPRTKPVSRVTRKKKQKTSPLKQFKESTKELKKEKKQPSVAKVPVKPATKKVINPKSSKDKASHTNLLHLGKTTKPKKENKSSLVMGEQLGKDKKSTITPTPSKSKNTSSSSKKPKPSSDNSLFSI